MSTNKKILTGILAFLPMILFVAYFVFMFGFVFDTIDQSMTSQPEDPSEFLGSFIGIFAIFGLMALSSLGALIYFLMHASNNPQLDSNEKMIWILIIVFLGIIGFPVYWAVKILNDKPQSPTV